MKSEKLLFYILSIFILLTFFRDFILVLDYFYVNKKIPFYKVNLDSSNLIIYIKDIGVLFWNIAWTLKLVVKKVIVNILLIFSLFIIFNIFLSIDNLVLLGVLADIRVLNTVYAMIGIYFIVTYYKNFNLTNIIKLFTFLVFIDAIASLIEFYLIGTTFGFRIMGLFSVAATNAYVLLMGELLLLLLYMYHKINKKKLTIISIIIFLSILTTGTRVAMVSFILLVLCYVFILIYMKKNLNKNLKLSIFSLMPLLLLVSFSFIITFSNKIADRGDVLNQSDAGRISKLSNIVNTLEDRGKFYFGEGSGWGSNIVSSTVVNIPKEYQSVDGTIQFLFIHSGIIGLIIILLLSFYAIYYTQRYNKILFFLLILPIVLIGLSVDVLEQTIVMLAFGLAFSYSYQQEYIKRRLKSSKQT